MKKLFIAAFIFVSTFTTSTFADIKMGVILGFTGPIESLTPAMAASAELAFKEASDSGALLGGKKITPVRADSTCVDSAAAQSAAESTQVESPSTTVIVFPPNNEPELEASSKANFAESLIAGVRDSIGPVNPKMIPILIACPSENDFVAKQDTKMNIAVINFFIFILYLLTIYKKLI